MEEKLPMQVIMDYIDGNINEDLSVERLAEAANISVPQLFRLFAANISIAPIKYTLKRRLFFAAKKLVTSTTKVVDVAFLFGFESHDSFSRAFKRVYGATPSEFRDNALRLHPFYRNGLYCIAGLTIPESLIKHFHMKCVEDESNLRTLQRRINDRRDSISCGNATKQVEDEEFMKEQQEIFHDVEIVTVAETKLIGVECPVGGGSFEVFYEAYDKIFKNAPNRKYPNSANATHGVPRANPDGGKLFYFVGIEVTSLDNIPDGAVSIVLPEQLCAVIGYEGGVDYDELCEYFRDKWLKQSSYKPDPHKIDSRFSKANVWKTYFPIWEYYTPNKDFELYEERIYMPVLPGELK